MRPLVSYSVPDPEAPFGFAGDVMVPIPARGLQYRRTLGPGGIEIDPADLRRLTVILPSRTAFLPSQRPFDELVIRWLPPTEGGKLRWELVKACRITVARDARVPWEMLDLTVPAGFRYDLATFPPAAYVVAGLLGLDRDVLALAATAHDWAIHCAETDPACPWDRHHADELFRALVEQTSGLSQRDSDLCYIAVRGGTLAAQSAFRTLARVVPSVALALLRR